MSTQELYDQSVGVLDALRHAQREHRAAQPNCDGTPLCIGMVGAMLLGEQVMRDPGAPVNLIVAAVGELNRLAAESEAADRRLGVQRDMIVDATRRIEAAEGAEQALAAKVDELEHALAAAKAELTIWEDAADTLGPVIEP